VVDSRSPARQLQFPPAPRPQRETSRLSTIVAVVVVALAVAGVVWYVATRPGPQNHSADAPGVPPAAEAVTAAPPSEPAAVPPGRGRVSTSSARARADRQGSQQTSPAAAAPGAALPPPAPKTATDEVLLIAVPKAGEGPVFSAKDAGVTPPTLVSPRVNTSLEQPEAADDLSTIDLVVSDAGHVESVKLASPVRDYREAMMLSAVKAWRFKPASIDGMPVRYQLRIRISVNSAAAGIR